MAEIVEKRWDQDPTCCMGTISVAKCWRDGMDLWSLRLYDAIAGGSDLSTSHDQDFAWFGCASKETWLYGNILSFL